MHHYIYLDLEFYIYLWWFFFILFHIRGEQDTTIF